ncbi:zf-HC2 domain-containing protein [Burkholderia contaminans]|uniref:zf-HC2 domain-containing protein n=1 Tax=Burkholderia contaminans TaxID=488447 RepID=UPI0031164AD7
MLTCKETTELLSKEADEGLNLRESLDMRLHILMCSACRNYRSNVQFLRRACRSAATPEQSPDAAPKDAR